MKHNNLRALLDALGSDNSEAAISELSAYVSDNPDIIDCVLTQYPYDKSAWSGKAQIIAAQSDRVLEHYASSVLDWLRDLSWPGSMLLFQRLSIVRPGKMDAAIAECIDFAEDLGDDEWAEFLRELQASRSKI